MSSLRRAQRPGLILQLVNGEPQGDRPWDETAAMLRTTDKGGVRPLHLTFVPPTLESLQTAMIGVDRARRKFNQLLSPQRPPQAQAQLQPEPEPEPPQRPPQGDAYGGSDAGTAEPQLQRTPLRTPTAEPELAASPLPAASAAASPAVRQTAQTMSARLDRARQQAEQEDAELHKQLRQVELEMSRMSLLAEPEATDPLELLASPAAGAYGGASLSAAGGVIAQVRHRLSRTMLETGGEPDEMPCSARVSPVGFRHRRLSLKPRRTGRHRRRFRGTPSEETNFSRCEHVACRFLVRAASRDGPMR